MVFSNIAFVTPAYAVMPGLKRLTGLDCCIEPARQNSNRWVSMSVRSEHTAQPTCSFCRKWTWHKTLIYNYIFSSNKPCHVHKYVYFKAELYFIYYSIFLQCLIFRCDGWRENEKGFTTLHGHSYRWPCRPSGTLLNSHLYHLYL